MPRPISILAISILVAASAFRAAGQVPDSVWVYPSAAGNLLYQLDGRGQRIADFSQCGYRGGTEPLPNVNAVIPQNRWVYVSPGLAAGHTVIIKRPSTTGWIAAIDMDQLDIPWTEGGRDLFFDRTITRIDGNWITVDAPLPQTFESQYGGGQIWRYTWSGRMEQVGIEDIYAFSDFASDTDEEHAWNFIYMSRTQPVEFAVTPQVMDSLLDDGKLSLRILSTDNHGANGNVSYASRTNATAANRPQLILTIENPPTAAIKTATGSALNLGTAWTGGFVPVNPDTATWNATSLAGTMTLGSDLSWAGLIINNPAAALTFNGTQTLILGSAGIDMSAATVDLTLNHPVLLGESQTWNVGASRTLAANGIISGPGTLTKTGAGNLAFSGSNINTGDTIINQGKLAITTSNPSLTGGLTFGAGAANTTPGILDLTTANATFAAAMVVNTGNAADTFDANGDGELNLLEYATAQNPTTASLVTLTPARNESAVDITYSRSKGAFDSGMIFTVEWSDTLAPDSWSTAGVTESILSDDGSLQSVKSTILTAPAIPTRFARLKVSQP